MKFWYIIVTIHTDLGLNYFPYLVFEYALRHSSKSSTGQDNIQSGRTRFLRLEVILNLLNILDDL